MKINFTHNNKLTFSQGAGLAIAAIVLVTSLLICLLTWINLTNQLQQNALHDAQRQLQRLALTLAPSMLVQDRISLNLSIKEWNQGNEFYALQVLNNNQQLLAETGRVNKQGVELSQIVTQDNMSLGSLHASLNLTSVAKSTQRYLSLGLLASLLCTLLAGLVGWMLAEYFFGYLQRFAHAVEHWQNTPDAELNLPKAPKLPHLDRLHQAFKHCAEQQSKHQDITQALEQFAGNAATQTPAAQYHSCALLFIEIENLKSLQKELSAEALIDTLNRYYWLLVQAAKLYHGRLERYAGNGAVLLFGIDESSTSAQSALHCLYAAQLFLGLINNEQQQNTQPFIDFRVAAHFGDVLLTPIADLQSGRYDLLGDTLHWAAHLANQSTNQQLLASDAFHSHLSQLEQVLWREGQQVNDLRGNSQKTWWLQSLPSKQQALIERQITQLAAHSKPVSEAKPIL